jgi:hypothetical protein
MTRYPGGGIVESGWYLDTRSLALVNLAARGRLPGSRRESFVRVPLPALLLLAPWVGGAWLLAAPVIGLATAAWGLAGRVAAAGARGLAAAAARGHAPGEAHLVGRPGRSQPGPDAGMDQLERDIAARRRDGERPADS